MSRVVLVHGFTQTAGTWATVAPALASEHEVVPVDLPGHGTRADLRADLHEAARLLGEDGGEATYVGYSLGGRVALHLALRDPARVRALVLVGATAGIDDPGERAERRTADERLADHLESVGAARFLDEWLAQPLFAGLPPEARGERSSDTAGMASSLRLTGTGTQAPLWQRLPELTMPVLVVAGERDAKFRSIGERLAASIGENAQVAIVAGAGHSAHLEQPKAFLGVLQPWLQRHA